MSEYENPNKITVKIDNTVLEDKHKAEMALKQREVEDEKIAKETALAELAIFKQKEAAALAEQEQREAQRANRKPATGSVPPNTTTNGQGKDPRRGYQTYGELVDDLRIRDDKETTDALFAKMLQEMKNGAPLGVSGQFNPENKSLAEIFNENRRARIRLNGVE